MFRSLIARRYLLLSWICIIVAMLAAPPAAPGAAAASPSISASPSAIALSLTLGTSSQQTISLSNTTDSAVTPLIYAAREASSGTNLQAARPSDPSRVALPQQSERIEPALLSTLKAKPQARSQFIIYLSEQADLSGAYVISDWASRGTYVYQTLSQWAAQHQSGLRAALSARGLHAQPLWIVNAVLSEGTLADAQAIAARSDVAMLRANHTSARPIERPSAASASDCSPDDSSNPICWDLRMIGVDRVWDEFGVTGSGVTLANIDTGVSYTHPALASSYRGYRGSGSYSHDYNWFDPYVRADAPADSAGHGTHTMGTMVGVGDGTTAQPSVGVAPGAQWIAARGCDAITCDEANLIAAAQWMLAPTAIDGSGPRPDLRPMIINNSWAGTGGDSWYAGYTAAWRAAGIFPVFAAGNTNAGVSQTCGSVGSPGDYSDVVGVGATSSSDTITSFSLLGPSSAGVMKPDITAPGGSIVSSWNSSSGYQVLSGTSMAAPHIAGVVALLWSANPALIGDYDATYKILTETASRVSDTRCGDAAGQPNNVYGYGRVSALDAVARARVDVPWLTLPSSHAALAAHASANIQATIDAARVSAPGVYKAQIQIYSNNLSAAPTSIPVTLTVLPSGSQASVSGRIISSEDSQPLAATVQLQGGASASTDSSGSYTFTLPLGSYTLVAQASAYLSATQTITITGNAQLPDIALLPDQPRLALSSEPLSSTLAFAQNATIPLTITNSGTRSLNYHFQINNDTFGIWRSDDGSGLQYSWVDLPATAKTIPLSDNAYTDSIPLNISFPFYTYIFTSTVVNANGMIAFYEPYSYTGLDSACLPDNSMLFYTIAPFRADLDPSRGGKIRYGTLSDKQTFVISYENIPLHTGAVSDTNTFQILLHSDGRIGFQYKQLAALPNALSAGVQYTPIDFQQIGCGSATPIQNGLAIEFRPQPSSSQWLTTNSEEGTIQPGAKKVIQVSALWRRPTTNTPYRGIIHLISSDPTHASSDIQIQIQMVKAPVERRLPIVFSTS